MRDSSERLKDNVEAISHIEGLLKIQDFIIKCFSSNAHPIYFHEFEIDGVKFQNIIQEMRGDAYPDEVLIIGTSYDSYAAEAALAELLELSFTFCDRRIRRTLRLVAFINEGGKGSPEYERLCLQRQENIIGMINLDDLSNQADDESLAKGHKIIEEFLNDILMNEASLQREAF